MKQLTCKFCMYCFGRSTVQTNESDAMNIQSLTSGHPVIGNASEMFVRHFHSGLIPSPVPRYPPTTPPTACTPYSNSVLIQNHIHFTPNPSSDKPPRHSCSFWLALHMIKTTTLVCVVGRTGRDFYW